jgi:hypothetical protein
MASKDLWVLVLPKEAGAARNAMGSLHSGRRTLHPTCLLSNLVGHFNARNGVAAGISVARGSRCSRVIKGILGVHSVLFDNGSLPISVYLYKGLTSGFAACLGSLSGLTLVLMDLPQSWEGFVSIAVNYMSNFIERG